MTRSHSSHNPENKLQPFDPHDFSELLLIILTVIIGA